MRFNLSAEEARRPREWLAVHRDDSPAAESLLRKVEDKGAGELELVQAEVSKLLKALEAWAQETQGIEKATERAGSAPGQLPQER